MIQRILPILDNGHGVDTAGKRSPVWKDGAQLLEYEFNREVVRRTARMLRASGVLYKILVPEIEDIPLAERVRRANALHAAHDRRAVLFSVHANAGGGSGFECYTSKGTTAADPIATRLFNEAQIEFGTEWPMRADMTDGDPDKEADFYILRHTTMPAVLAEFFFMDTERDCRLILSAEGRERCAKVLFRTIVGLLRDDAPEITRK